MSRWVLGQISEVFMTTVLPQASGVASERTPRMTGAFQGAIDSTTPAGCRTAIASEPGRFDGITSPVICVVSAAASRSMSEASSTLKCDQPAVAPVSAAMAAMNSGSFADSMSAALDRIVRRSRGEEADHSGKAAAAASTAAMASSFVAAAAVVATLPEIGFRRSNVAPSEATVSSLPIISPKISMFVSLVPGVGSHAEECILYRGVVDRVWPPVHRRPCALPRADIRAWR